MALTALVMLQGPPTSAAATCKGLADDSSTFALFLQNTLGTDKGTMEDVMSALESIDTAAPWLSSCIASIDPLAVFSTVQLSSGYKTCNATISNFTMPEELDDKTVRDTFCPFYGETLMPCINSVAVQAMLDAMAGAGSCCDGLKAQIKTSFGTDIKTMAADMLDKVGETMCTVKTFTNSAGVAQSEACLSSLFTSFMTPETADYWRSLVQLPVDQVCKAVMGESFRTTLSATATQFKWAALGRANFGICYEPLSELIQMIGAYPMMATPMVGNDTSTSMANAFVPGKCLNSADMLSWMQDRSSWPMRWARLVDDVLVSLGYNASAILDHMNSSDGSKAWGSSSSWGDQPLNATTLLDLIMESAKSHTPAMCMHLASGQTCDYGGATTALAYKTAETSPSSTKAAISAVKSSAASVLLGMTFATTTTVGICSF